MRRILWAFLLAGAATVGTPLLAHHSFAVFYLEQDTIEVEGEVVEFQYVNPHSWIHVVAPDPFTGRQKHYAAEWSSVSALDRAGITKTFFHVGDVVRIWASPNKNPNDERVRLKRIERRSDGWKWGQGRGQTR